MKILQTYRWLVWLALLMSLIACFPNTTGQPQETAILQATEIVPTKTPLPDLAPQPEVTAASQATEMAPTQTPIQDNSIMRLESYLNELKQAGFRGAVLVDKGGEVIVSAGYGLTDDDSGTVITPATIFDIGSITKQFTGAAILKLEMADRLSVDDYLSQYMPNLPEDKQEITLHHLLTHTAGFPPALGDDYEAIDREAYIEMALQTPLLHTPGNEHVYSNVGYSLLAAVIEIVTNASYETYLREALFLPAGMNYTGYVLPTWNETDIAVGFRGSEAWGKPNEKTWADDGPYWHLRGNGGILSSAEDMYRWHQALLTDNILTHAAKEKYYTPYVLEGPDANSYYGYGWALFPTPRDTILITHNGGNGIFFADFWRYLEEEVTIFVATNAANRASEMVAANIAQIIFDPEFEPTVSDSSGPSQVISTFPDTPAGRTTQLLMNVLQNGDDDAKQDLVETHFSPQLFALGSLEQHIAILGQIQSEVAGLNLGTITLQRDEFFIELLDEDGRIQLTLIAHINADEPTLIQGISLD